VALVLMLTVGIAPASRSAGLIPTPDDGAAAAASAASAPKPRILALAAQSPWSAPDGNVELRLNVAAPPDGLELQVVVHRAVTSRTELGQTLAGRALGSVEGRLSAPVPGLSATDSGQRLLTLGVQGPASATAAPDPARIVPGRSGIYPTEVLLLRDGSVIDRFVTPLVVIAAGLSPLTMAWVWRFDATPAHQPDATIRRAAAKALEPGGRLVRTAQAAAGAGDHESEVSIVRVGRSFTVGPHSLAVNELVRCPSGTKLTGGGTSLIGEPSRPRTAPVVYTNGPVGNILPGERQTWASEVANASGETFRYRQFALCADDD